jgi:hypothetical protein
LHSIHQYKEFHPSPEFKRDALTQWMESLFAGIAPGHVGDPEVASSHVVPRVHVEATVVSQRSHGRSLAFLSARITSISINGSPPSAISIGAPEGEPENDADPAVMQFVLDAHHFTSTSQLAALMDQLRTPECSFTADCIPGRTKRGQPSLYITAASILSTPQSDPSLAINDSSQQNTKKKKKHRVARLSYAQHRVLESLAADSQLMPITDIPLADASCSGVPLALAMKLQSSTTTVAVDESRAAYWRTKKAPQLQWMLEQLRPILAPDSHHASPSSSSPPAPGRPSPHPIRVWDVGGGRGDLGWTLVAAFPHVEVTVIDVNADSLHAGQHHPIGATLGCGAHARIRFVHRDFLDCIQPQNKEDGEMGPLPTVVVALHACGGLTDAILAFLSTCRHPVWGVLCTCCFNKLRPLAARAWDRAAQPAGLWTHGLDAAHVHELLQVAELGDRPLEAQRAMQACNSLRLQRLYSVQAESPITSHQLASSVSSSSFSSIISSSSCHGMESSRLLRFPLCHSLKNQVLCIPPYSPVVMP